MKPFISKILPIIGFPQIAAEVVRILEAQRYLSILQRKIKCVTQSLHQIPLYYWTSAHFFLKLLPMIVKLSSITFYSILHRRFGIGTQNLHVNPSISASWSFLKMRPTSCETWLQIINQKFGFGTQDSHGNSPITENQRIFIFP